MTIRHRAALAWPDPTAFRGPKDMALLQHPGLESGAALLEARRRLGEVAAAPPKSPREP